jgi:hypothetical protein
MNLLVVKSGGFVYSVNFGMNSLMPLYPYLWE